MLTFVIQHSCLKEQGVLRNNLKKTLKKIPQMVYNLTLNLELTTLPILKKTNKSFGSYNEVEQKLNTEIY